MSLYTETRSEMKTPENKDLIALIDEPLNKIYFDQLCGSLGTIPFVKFVIDRKNKNNIHFLNNRLYPLHAYYICDQILKEPREEFLKKIDSFNEETYHSEDRRFLFGTIGSLQKDQRKIYTLETQEIDSLNGAMIEELFSIVKSKIDPNFELYFKPANHIQEKAVTLISIKKLPRIYSREIYSESTFIPLNVGDSEGRLRCFHTDLEFHAALESIEWYDIIVMPRIPDEVPRVSGMINSDLTTPLSHTNVLASGWKIPNCVQKDIFETIQKNKLDRKWVRLVVNQNATQAQIDLISEPTGLKKPVWVMQKIILESPDADDLRILSLNDVRMSDRYKYGTKAANIGEMKHVLKKGSERILGYYQVKRPPRENLLPHLAHFLKSPEHSDLLKASSNFLSSFLKVPRGIVLPFSMQRRFLETSPQIQQGIGKLKMALELDAHEIDALCISLQKMILKTRIPDEIKTEIDRMIIEELSGVSTFVLRSSSNAEDLDGFSAAGIYESVNHVTTSEKIFEAIKRVWASLVSPRSIRLRQQSGISLDDSYMGVIIQEEVESGIGGVMVTKNPTDKNDFRNVYINVSQKSVIDIVQGTDLPMQYLYSTVEGGGYTLSLGSATEELSPERLELLQKLAFAGRLMQSHFSTDYTFSHPVDIEWLANKDGAYFLQLRPYAK